MRQRWGAGPCLRACAPGISGHVPDCEGSGLTQPCAMHTPTNLRWGVRVSHMLRIMCMAPSAHEAARRLVALHLPPAAVVWLRNPPLPPPPRAPPHRHNVLAHERHRHVDLRVVRERLVARAVRRQEAAPVPEGAVGHGHVGREADPRHCEEPRNRANGWAGPCRVEAWTAERCMVDGWA